VRTPLAVLRTHVWPCRWVLLIAAALFFGLWIYWTMTGEPAPDYSWFWLYAPATAEPCFNG
jgi:hypothetical protein